MSDPITQFDITVTFDSTSAPRNVTFTPASDPAHPIRIDTNLGLVNFTLAQRGNFEARFPSNPIQWVDRTSQLPIDPPRAATVRRLSDSSATILFVAPLETTSFCFYVIVQTQSGRFLGSDPTIVTMPPGT